ncbi:betaine-aldehyde dehydrogenase [Microdochium nivale]|nr:betaine-aldehyde dehydrogenase [Microdochium nivale]
MDLTRYPLPLRAFIGGKFVDSVGDDKKELRSSVDDRVVTDALQWSNAADVEIAVKDNEKGLVAWQALPKAQKSQALAKMGELLLKHKEQLHWLDAVVTGKEYSFFSFELAGAADIFSYYAARVDDFQSDVLRSSDTALTYVLRQPYGLTAAIIPFNAPIITFAMKAAAALAAGNAMTIKTSELNPFATLFAAGLTIEAGIPAGTINMLTGGGAAGHALAAHPRIRKISFTGSVAVGKMVAVAAAQSNLKSVTLELGGKSPAIIFPDADLDRAIQAACIFLLNNGQGCSVFSRLYVHRDVAPKILAMLKHAVEAHEKSLGADPLSPSTSSSPLANRKQKESVDAMIKSGEAEAELFHGGSGPVGAGKGCYVKPTIFVNPKPDARVLNEEIFGPVLTVVEFETDDEVLGMANDSELGLAATVWTSNVGRALRFSRELEAGTVAVNKPGEYGPDVPFGGWKQSGGGLENGKDGLLDWTVSKTVTIDR